MKITHITITTALMLALCASAVSQTATITLQVTDAQPQAWNNGTWTVQLTGGTGTYNIIGTSTPVPNQTQSGALSGTGGATVIVTPNTSIAPANTQWTFSVCPQATSPCFQQGFTIVGNISLTIQPPVILINLNVPLARVTAYNDNELTGQGPGSQYFNLSALTQRVWNGSAWVPLAGSAGLADPGSNGVLKRTSFNVTAIAAAADLIALWSGTCNITTFLRGDGTCATPPGTSPAGNDNQIQIKSGASLAAAGTNVATAGNLNSIRYVTADYNWSQSPSGSIAPGVNVVNLVPCPAGILVSYGFTSTPWTAVLVTGAPGASETPIISATTCTQQGGSNGSITFTAANTHNAGFTVGTATVGFQEATNASMQTVVDSTILQTGIVIQSPGDRTWQARATVMSSGVDIYFSGPTTCAMSDTCLFIGDSADQNRVRNVSIHKFTPRAGVVNGNFTALETNAQNTRVEDMMIERSLVANVSFGSFITVDDDENFTLDGLGFLLDVGMAHCSTDFCTTAIKTGTGSAVGHLSHIDFTGGCKANGIEWLTGNTLSVRDSVIQAQAQFAGRVHGSFGNNISVEWVNVYGEVAGCAQLNPLGIGVAGLITDAHANVSGGVGPLGTLQRFANTGSTQLNYYVVIHSTTGGVSAPFPIGIAKTSGTGNITVKWPQLGTTGTITYDILRTSGFFNNPAPYTAVCGGGTPTTCGSVAVGLTVGAACAAVGSSNICSFVDDAAANTAAYTVTTSAPYWPQQYVAGGAGFAGGLIYGSGFDVVGSGAPTHGITLDTCCDNTANSQADPVSQMWSQYGPEVPVFVAHNCSNVSGGALVVCLNAEQGTINGSTMLRTGAYNSADPPSTKGRLIFEQARNSIDRYDLITFTDTNWAKTLATTGNRPSWDAGDMALGQDATSGAASTNILYFRSQNNIRSYINTIPNGSAWLEDLSSTLKTFKVPLQFNGSTSGNAQISVAAVAGTPNKINLPIATAATNGLLQSDGANPQQTSWTLTPALTTLSLTGQFTSTLASGTSPLVVTSTTPVANLAATPTTYNHSGTQQVGTHVVIDSGTLSGGTLAVTLTGAAVFTNSSSYVCTANDTTALQPIELSYASGSSVTFTGTGGDTFRYMCVGN